MLEISYRLTLACPVYVILSQYYDYEHIRTVHPHTLGAFELVEVREEGREVIYDHLWPRRRNGRQLVSRVRHRYFPPLTMEFDFVSGRYKGTRVRTLLAPQGSDSTLVDETYFIPGLPNWGWLAWGLRPFVMKKVNTVWKEDLQVGVCIDGWPGIPACARREVERQELKLTPEPLPIPLTADHVPENQGRCYAVGKQMVAVFNTSGQLHALDNRCPHTGGPLSRGRLTADKQCVECPWHGARFKLTTGEHTGGPGNCGVAVVELTESSR